MASIRLHGVFDAVMREALPERRLIALADRIEAGAVTATDRVLIEAFGTADLKAAKITAAAFIVGNAAPFRAVAAVMRRVSYVPDSPETNANAAAVVRGATETLRQRLQVRPDAYELERLGDLFEQGDMTPADIMVIRSLPAPYLRANALTQHYSVIFVDYRIFDR